MRRTSICICILGFVVSVCSGMMVSQKLVTRTVNTNGCVVPTAVSSFQTSDPTVWLWFSVSGASGGDTASATWYSPGGAAYLSSSWNPVASSGDWCYWTKIDVANNPPAASPGAWSVAVNWNGSRLFTLNFTISSAIPSITTGGVLNAASYVAGAPLTPGGIAAAFGSFPVSGPTVASAAPWPTTLGNLSLEFPGGIRAPLYYVSGGQVNFLVPWELTGQSQTTLTAIVNGQRSAPQTLALTTFSPGTFAMNGQGTGQGAIVDAATGKLADAVHPVVAGSTYVSIYGTGLGPVSNRPPSGGASPTNPLSSATTAPVVAIGGLPAKVVYAGLAPGFVGETQVNALVPQNTAPGSVVPVTVTVGGVVSNVVTIAVSAPTGGPTPSLTLMNPASGNAGQVISVVLTAANTGFVQGQTTANFGPGISVGGAPEGLPGPVSVSSSTTATATLTIDPLASAGSRNVVVATGAQAASAVNGFSVLAPISALPSLAVTSTIPADRSTGVSLTPEIQITFNGPLDPATVGPSTIALMSGSTSVPLRALYDSSKQILFVQPIYALSVGATYVLKIGTGLRNAAEVGLSAPYSLSFSTLSPITVTGTVSSPGLDPRTLTVLSYGGTTSKPDSTGKFTAAVSPVGNTLVAAVLPDKTFALMALLTNGRPSASIRPGVALHPGVPAHGEPTIHETHWQITASVAAATTTDPVLDYQTTAEALVFMSPYVYTGDPLKATFTKTAVARSQSTQAFATVLQTQTIGTGATTQPMTSPVVVSAGQVAVQDAVAGLLPQFANITNADSTPPTLLGCVPQKASSTFPAGIKATPYCKGGAGGNKGDLPCLDLDYISFCDAITGDQGGQSYTVKPVNCTNRTLRCAVGWLARITSITEDPNDLTTNLSAPDRPSALSDKCDAQHSCQAAWIAGDSVFAYADIFDVFSKWLTRNLLSSIKDASGSLPLPATPGNYLLRFYSGGIADARELSGIRADDYTDGKQLNMLAAGVNFAETALNIASIGFNTADALAPGTGSEAASIAECALQGITQSAIEIAAGQSAGSVTAGVKVVGDLGAALLTNATSCGVSAGSEKLFKVGAQWLLASTGVGAVVEVAVNAAAAAGNAAEALQRSYELQNSASAVETAVIQVFPAAIRPPNPVPKISTLSPASLAVGSGTTTVTIRGSGFLDTSTVLANNAKRSYTFVDSGTLTLPLSSSDLQQAGSFSVEVRNPAPGGGTTSAIFLVTSGNTGNPAPQVTSLVPAAVVLGGTPPVLSILGRNFLKNSTVTVGGRTRPITTPFDAKLLTVALQADDIAQAASVPVVVSNPSPGGGTSSLNLNVVSAQSVQPMVLSVSTAQRQYVAGDQFSIAYSVLANSAATTRYDLMIAVASVTSGNTYYYYDDASDSNRWLHTSARAAVSNFVPASGEYVIPSGSSAFEVTSSVPTGDYHVKAYFSTVGANQPLGTTAQTDFSVATETAAGGCFIATAAFGSPMSSQVRLLRHFRDKTLLSASLGRAFVAWYYTWSPRGARWLSTHPLARKATRAALWILITFAWVSVRVSLVAALLLFAVLATGLWWGIGRVSSRWRIALGVAILIAAALA